MTTLWTIAGALSGYVIFNTVATAMKVNVPTWFNLSMAFVGGLTAYTIIST